MSEPRLPTFIGIGAAKCGTTAVCEYLREHPEVFVSPVKETNFFAYDGQAAKRFRIRSWSAYLDQFAEARGARAVGEFSPYYMNYLPTASRIAAALPEVKLLAILRSPAERAYSHWINMLRSGNEVRSAEEALRPGEWWIEAGFYRERLEPYLTRFPRDRIEIVLFEDLRAEPVATMQRIYAFLGVDQAFVPNIERRHNEASFPRHPRLNLAWARLRRLQPWWFSAPAPLVRLNARLLERTFRAAPPIDPGLHARLHEHYLPEVERMEELLGRELPSWRAHHTTEVA